MADWYPRAIRQQLGDAGGFVGNGAPKLLWHTTEGDSYPGTGIYHGTNPHFTCDFKRRKTYQHVPLSRAAKALAHPANRGQTNKDNVIQVELVGRAAGSGHWSAGDYAYIADLARWIERNHGVPRKASVSFSNPRRLGWTEWHKYAGHIGHVHCPYNDHTDPGKGFRIDLVIGETLPKRDYASRLLKPGSRGTDVHDFQVVINRRLKELGKGPVSDDGEYGAKTERARYVVAFYLGFPMRIARAKQAGVKQQRWFRLPRSRPLTYKARSLARKDK